MGGFKKLSHVIWQCKYHIIWCPKYRYKVLDGNIARLLEVDIRMLCEWKGVEVLELSVCKDHIHIVVSIPPKLSVSQLMGILKGKTAIKVFKSYPELKRKPYWGNHFWSRGYCISTIGMDEDKIRKYVKYQEDNERREEEEQDQFGLF
jgi:putative transposase